MSDQDKKDNNKDGELTPEQYQVCRLNGTEAPFSGQYWNHKESGIYLCVCCSAALFSSSDKFDSSTGWPSYVQPVNKEVTKEIADNAHGMRRIEVRCKKCDAHLGHVFPDGPKPTGLRYCINSNSLRFDINKQK